MKYNPHDYRIFVFQTGSNHAIDCTDTSSGIIAARSPQEALEKWCEHRGQQGLPFTRAYRIAVQRSHVSTDLHFFDVGPTPGFTVEQVIR